MIDGKRHYDINDKEKLPSVTTILSQTQSAEKTEGLRKWRESKGELEATRIVDESGARGTAMHKILEEYIKGDGYLDLTKVGKEAHNMAMKVISDGLCNVTEYYGLESTLYYPGLYAGATDMIALHNNRMTIIDFKQSNKPKKDEWIDDYYLQCAAYSLAHNKVHSSNITQVAILLCTKDNIFQRFIVEGERLISYQNQFLEKVEQFYSQRMAN